MKSMTQFQACTRPATMLEASSGAATMGLAASHAHTFGRLAGQAAAGLALKQTRPFLLQKRRLMQLV